MRGPPRMCRHAGAVRYFNQLIIDLKKRELGFKFEPISMERLDEASKHIQDIQSCTRPVVLYHGV